MPKGYTHLTPDDRCQIEVLLRRGDSKRDIYLLTTDGIHDILSSAELSRLLVTAKVDTAKMICDAAFAKSSPDNLSCQVIHIRSTGQRDADGHGNVATRLPFPKPLLAGDTIDDFTIVRTLHESNRSQVYLATVKSSNETVVLKTPSLNFADDTAYIEAFAHEEWVGRSVTSPNTLRFHNASGQKRFLYHVTEFFDGKTLQQWIHDNPNPDFESVRKIVEQVATGLRAMHRKDILHLDLKPGNIIIDGNGLVKIIDFGSSRAASWSDSFQNKSEIPAGTADYTAPENLRGEPPANRSDIYSLAAIAYEMLTGQLPYGQSIKTVSSIKKLRYVSATTRRKDMPNWMDAALENAVQLDPLKRTEALSAFTTNLRKPNSALIPARHRPLIERDPVMFWRSLCLLMFALSAVLTYLLASRV